MKVLSLILALIQLRFGFCLYEDQIGIFDWRQSYIGHVTHAAYDAVPDSSGNRAVFVGASETGVIGALSTKDGSVIWRHVFGENERISLLTLYGDCLLVIVGKTARCFYPEGILKTQLSLPINDNEEIKFSHATDETVVFGTDSNFCLLKGNEYKCIPLTGVPKNSFHVNCMNDVTGCVISQEGSAVTIFQADVDKNEKISKLSKGSISGQITNCGGGFDGKGYNCLLSNGKIFSQSGFAHFDSSKVGFLDPESCALGGNDNNKVKKSKFVGNFVFAEYENGKTVLCDLKQSKKLQSGGGNLVEAAEVKFEGESKLFKLIHTGEANYRLELSDLDGTEIAHSTFQCNEIAKEGVGLMIPIVLKKRGTSSRNAPILRGLIRSKFDSLIFVQAASVKWVRDEGLGQSVAATFFDLPLPDYLADIASEVMDSSNNIFVNFVRRVRFESDILFSTVFDLVDGYSNGGFGSLLNINKDVKHSLLHHAVHRHTPDGRNVDVELHRDKFGLEKLILVATKPGKVFAIHSLTGVVVWDLFFQDCRPISIHQIRGTDNAELPSVVTVVGQNLQSNGQLCLVSFDGLTGDLQEKLTLPFLPGVVKSFPHTDPETHITPLLIVVPSLNSVSVYPEIELKFVKMHSNDVYLHLVTENPTQQPTLNGFKLQEANSNLKMKETWSVVIPNGENVVQVAEKRADERIYSKAIVLADRTVLYKFMNPNLIFIITSNALDQDKKEGDAGMFFLIYLCSVFTVFFTSRYLECLFNRLSFGTILFPRSTQTCQGTSFRSECRKFCCL